MDVESLKKWFLQEKRDLPWREGASPYSVWVSEVMLQQTQSSVVIPYFERWMRRFPTIRDLACASVGEVLKEWEGLGYYSRARNLHEGARYIVEKFDGKLPDKEDELNMIKGLGPYTIGAIRSFAFHQKAHCVDGNVIRVIARLFMVAGDITKPRTVREIQDIVQKNLPDKEPWVISEALIELGALICQKSPKCIKCPLKGTCQSYLKDQVEKYPVKALRPKIEKLFRGVAVISSDDSFLLQLGEKGKIMHGLYEFPYFETGKNKVSTGFLKEEITRAFSLSVSHKKALSMVNHSFTRYRVSLFPHLFTSDQRKDVNGFTWVSRKEMSQLPFSSGHKRVYMEICR